MKKNARNILCSAVTALSMLLAPAANAYAAKDDESVKPNTWVTDDGKFYYYGEDSAPVTGVQTIDGEKYLFAQNGVLKTGWRTVDGVRNYYDPETGKRVTGWFDYCGRKYYIAPADGKAVGVCADNENKLHYFDDYGTLVEDKGFYKTADNKLCYVGSNGLVASGKQTIGNYDYLLGDDGYVKTGWQEINGKKFYFDPETGKAANGLTKIGDDIYYFNPDDGAVTGNYKDTDFFGKFDEDGKLQTGWQALNKKLYYFDPETGALATGKVKIED